MSTICEHLAPLEAELIARKIPVTFRGQAWSDNCREWVYFDCYLDLESIRARMPLAACVIDHVNDDPKSGQERGFVYREHHDAIMGLPRPTDRAPVVS